MMTLDAQMMTDLSVAARARQAEALLTVPGPLPREVCFSPGVAGMAYMTFLAYGLGRHKILKGRPGYEAKTMLAARVRSAATRAGSLDEWAQELLTSVGVTMDQLKMEDRMWWRSFLALHDGAVTRRLLQKTSLSEVITAAELLQDWLYQIRDHTKAKSKAAEVTS